jgi:hypothetical protein
MSSRTERLEAKVDELEQRIATLEKIQSQGIDLLIMEVRRLFDNDAVIGEAVESHDTTIASIRSLLVAGKVLTDEAIDARSEEIEKIRSQAEEERAQQAELREIEFKAAEAAKEEAGHPKEAFIFAG